ncbi:MAG: zinc ribbon domain-containing protein [Desulfobacterales bacterium]
MVIKTKDDVLEEMMTQERPRCPHCNEEMTIWEVPPINFSDGLGWGSPYLYLCFNDECPLYVQGWDDMKENYAHHASYRCFTYPDQKNFEYMPVFSPMGAKGQIIDDEVVLQQEMLKEATKRGFSILAECYTNKDDVTIVRILLDAAEPVRVRVKAAEMFGDLCGTDAIEPVKSARFGNPILQDSVENAIKKIHVRHFTRECPFCAEIIKKRAKICKHCNSDVSGV